PALRIAASPLQRLRGLWQNKTRADAAPSREQLEFILDNTLDLICHLDAGNIISYISPSVERTLGFTPAQMIGTSFLNWFAQVHPDDRDELKARFARVTATQSESSAEYRFRHADGHYLWLEARVRLIADGGTQQGIVIVARDIDERKQAEEQLLL